MSVYRAVVAYREATDRADCPLSATARQLWGNLAGRVDYDGACWPEVDTLCIALAPERIDVHGNPVHANRSTVKRATAELVAFGVLDVLVAHGRHRRNTYRLALAPESNAAPAQRFPAAENGALMHENGALAPRFPACGQVENGALVHENGALVHAHIGEVAKRSRRDASTSTIEETAQPCAVSTEADPAAYRAYRKRMVATGGQVMPAWYYFTVPRDGDGNPVNQS